jgi:hypothetical protein
MHLHTTTIAFMLVFVGITGRPASAQLMTKPQVGNLIKNVENGVDEFRVATARSLTQTMKATLLLTVFFAQCALIVAFLSIASRDVERHLEAAAMSVGDIASGVRNRCSTLMSARRAPRPGGRPSR